MNTNLDVTDTGTALLRQATFWRARGPAGRLDLIHIDTMGGCPRRRGSRDRRCRVSDDVVAWLRGVHERAEGVARAATQGEWWKRLP